MTKKTRSCLIPERPILRRCRAAALILSLMTTVMALLSVAFALATRRVIDIAVSGGEGLLLWAAILIGIAVAVPVLRLIMGHFSGRTIDRMSGELRSALLRLLQHKDCEKVNAYHSGYLFSRMVGDCRTVCDRYTSLYPTVVGQLVQLVSAFAALIMLQKRLALIILLCGGAVAAVGLMLRRVLRRRHIQVRQAEEKMTSCLQEDLENFELSRSVASNDEVIRRFDLFQKAWLRARDSLRALSLGGSALFLLLLQFGSALLIIWGAACIRSGKMTYGDLMAMIQLVGLFRSPVSGLTGIQSKMAAVDAAQERLAQLYDIEDEPMLGAIPDGEVCRAVVLEHVVFSYAGEERPVFSDLNARIEFDRWTGLTGVSGRGKSTLFRLLLGLYRPDSGKIYVETDSGCYPISASTRSLFGFVPQAPILFSGSIRDNLLLARPEASDEELWHALELAECEFLHAMPDGLDTDLGEGGEGLSVGQRQRVAVARALLRDTKLLLLDEVTSALDQETEKRLLENLSREFPSVLIATHRLGALQGIDMQGLSLV